MCRKKIKNYILPILGIFILLNSSCSENDNYEVIPSEKILPQAKGNYDYAIDSKKEDTVKRSEFELGLKAAIPNILFPADNEMRIAKTRLLPNQLGFKEKEETYFMLDSIPYHFVEWTFSDSTQTVNSFYNWLDCFGDDCRSIRINEEKNGCKQAFVIWVSNTKIAYLESSEKIERTKWESVFFDEKGAWNFIIQQAPNRKIIWEESPTKKS